MLKGLPCNASIVAIAEPHTICFKLNKAAFEKHLRGKNKKREAMIEESGAGKMFKIKHSRNKSSQMGMMTNSGRRSSLVKIADVKARVSGLDAADIIGDGSKDSDNTGRMSYDWVNKGKMVDSTGDGILDTMGYDTNNDGKIDTYLIDTTGDGKKNALGFDTDGDGIIDMIDEGNK